MEFLRLGLIGCGKMMGSHVVGVKYVDNVDIVAVCDIKKENAEAVAEELGNNPKVYTDYKDMVDDVDAVMIALPHDLHYECGMFFAFHDKHILMEKPLCNTEEECLSLIAECEKRNLKLMCAYPVPFWRGIVKLKEFVDSGEFGKIMQMSIWTEQLTQPDITKANNWGATARIGGGQLFSHGCHYIDLLLRFLGNPVEGAHVGTRIGTPGLLREGTSALVMKFENGAVGYHGATWGARGTRMGYDFQVHTEKGLFDYDHHAGTITYYSKEEAHEPGKPSKNTKEILWDEGTGKKHTNNEIDHFVDCVLGGKTPLTSGRTALESLRVIWKMYDAEKNHTVADLRDINPNSYL